MFVAYLNRVIHEFRLRLESCDLGHTPTTPGWLRHDNQNVMVVLIMSTIYKDKSVRVNIKFVSDTWRLSRRAHRLIGSRGEPVTNVI